MLLQGKLGFMLGPLINAFTCSCIFGALIFAVCIFGVCIFCSIQDMPAATGDMLGPLGIVKTLRRPEVSHSCLHDILHVGKVHMDIRSSPSTTPSFKTDSDSESKYVFLRVNLFNCDIFVSRQPGLSHGAFGWQCWWSDPGSGLLANENTKQSTQDIVYYSCIYMY